MRQDLSHWNVMTSLPPQNHEEASEIVSHLIKKNKDFKNPIAAGMRLGRMEGELWIKHLFKQADPTQRVWLAASIAEGFIPEAIRHDDATGKVEFFMYEEDCPEF